VELDYSIAYFILLIVVGFIAGIINTLAGGGSNLTLPALMVTGMPADIANATNRLAVLMQSIVGSIGFKKHGQIDSNDLGPVLIPCLIGGVFGAYLASVLPVFLLKPTLLISMVAVAAIILIRPAIIAPPPGTPTNKVKDTPKAWIGLFIAGIYGGFVQAGVGFILITALAGTLRYDLVRSNALKMVCTLAFTLVAMAFFIAQDLVLWIPGLILAIGSMVGAWIAVKVSIKVEQNTIKWFLFLMTLVACGAALLTP
jgi:uncharacterized membrane protein YfcA